MPITTLWIWHEPHISLHSESNVKILHPYKQYVRGSFKNGKLHGLIQIYGKMSVDPKGHCSEKHFEGLSFLGWFEEGKPTGPCWRFLGALLVL